MSFKLQTKLCEVKDSDAGFVCSCSDQILSIWRQFNALRCSRKVKVLNQLQTSPILLIVSKRFPFLVLKPFWQTFPNTNVVYFDPIGVWKKIHSFSFSFLVSSWEFV